MLELWASLKVWTEYIIPIAIFLLIMLIVFLYILIDSFKWNRKVKFLKKNGYTRYLVGVPSFGNGAFYGWKNEILDKRIDEREMERLSYKQFVKKMNN